MSVARRCIATASLLLLGVSACADGVTDPNRPDAERAIATPGDALSLVGNSYLDLFYANYSYFSGGLALSNAAFQHNTPWACCGMEKYSRLPRISFINSISDGDYAFMTRPWFSSYKALVAVTLGLRALERESLRTALTEEELKRAKAFGRFVQGLGHAQIAVLFAEGFVTDETTDLEVPLDPVPYAEVMAAAVGYFDEAIALSESADWTLPEGWMQAALTGPDFARAARSYRARFRAAVARTWTERQTLPWADILADIDAGITTDLVLFMNDADDWGNDVLGYGVYPGWSQMAYFVYGMADQSGDYQAWEALPLSEKHPTLDGDPVLIVTPDLRFARGTTVEEQRESPGAYFRISADGAETGDTWARPDRGTWRWSWYKHERGSDYWMELRYHQPEIRVDEMRLLKAEGLYHMGRRAEAAALVNVTREAWGLGPTDAAGTNASCVPRLPGPGRGYDTAPGDNRCGGLFEMLKWEKRMENTFKGPMGGLWYFDGRAWGDLWKDTFLHLPIPCEDAIILGFDECGTTGGPGGEDGAPMSVYRWTGEG